MSEALPFVSVIVPVYNDPGGIRNCLEALRSQTYPDEQFEVLVVDNGSTDETREVIGEFDVELLIEDEIQGSYAARNRGIRNAQGEVLAFTDADCTPDPEWIAAGVEVLEGKPADLVGGQVRFELSAERTAAERFDASVNMRNDISIKDGIAKTANLFVRRQVVEETGVFPESLISGGDVYWTRATTDAGFELKYAENAIVEHQARKFTELLRKHFRVGRGQVQVWRLRERSTLRIIFESTLGYPLKIFDFMTGNAESTAADSSSNQHETDSNKTTSGVYLVAIAVVLTMVLGRVYELVQINHLVS